MDNIIIKGYIHQLQQAYYGGNWLDEDVEKKLRQVNEENAYVKPYGYLHSIAEITSHIVEWRRELIERFLYGRQPRLTMESANNWIDNEVLKEKGWAWLKQQLKDTQAELISLLEEKDDAFLLSTWNGNDNYEWMLVGLIQHDIYHLGQIGLVYKMITYQSDAN